MTISRRLAGWPYARVRERGERFVHHLQLVDQGRRVVVDVQNAGQHLAGILRAVQEFDRGEPVGGIVIAADFLQHQPRTVVQLHLLGSSPSSYSTLMSS